nr:hypothetical protein [Megavirus caiporensis]
MTQYNITGKILSTKICNGDVYKYLITDNKGETKNYTHFAKNEGILDKLREINITYYVKNTEKYGSSNIIKKIEYGDYIKDTKNVKELLITKIKVSKSLVDKIHKKYGDEIYDVVFNNTDVLKEIKHQNIDNQIEKIKSYIKKSRLDIELSNLGIPCKYHEKIIKAGIDIDTIKENIYNLYIILKIPFEICDEIAMKLGYEKNDENRINAFIIIIYKKFNSIGVLYESQATIHEKSKKYGITIDEIIKNLKEITIDGKKYYTTGKIYKTEQKIEKICCKLANNKPITKIYRDDYYYANNTQLWSEQILAVRNSLENCLSIITGPPGTGKSYIINEIINELHKKNCIYILAPTGAAIERLRTDDLCKKSNVQMKTIHSFIYKKKYTQKNNDDDNSDDNDNKILLLKKRDCYTEFVFIIDEMSMVDMHLFYKFLKIISGIIDKTRLIIIGDENQLPSIKGGYVLNNLISSNKIVVSYLKENHRSEGKIISNNAELILNGKDIKPDNKYVEYIKVNDKKEITASLKNVIKKYKIEHSKSCVLIPIRKGAIGINYYNIILQNVYNSENKNNEPDKYKIYFRKNDKIIHGKNNKEKDIYNGSILEINDIETDDKGDPVTIISKYYKSETKYGSKKEKDFRIVEYKNPNKENENEIQENKLDLAYAMTIHKAQGKGYDTVIIILHSDMYTKLLNRNMLYTAITRAKKKCIIISNENGLHECKKLIDKRITNLFRQSKNPQSDEKQQVKYNPTDIIEVLTMILKKIRENDDSEKMIELLLSKKIDIKQINQEKKTINTIMEMSKLNRNILTDMTFYKSLINFK